MFSATSLEAQKLISVSIGKMNASRVTRTGASLHRSLLVATVLHKARNIYFEEERERVAKFPPPEVTVTPVCHLNNPHLNINTLNPNVNTENKRSECPEDEVAIPESVSEQSKLPLAEANTDNNITHTTNTTTTVTSVTNSSTVTTSTNNFAQNSRKRRRVSDQETAAAVSSILPKRLRSELREDIKPYERFTSDGKNDTYHLGVHSTKIETERENIRGRTSESMEETSLPVCSETSCTVSCDTPASKSEDNESTGRSQLYDTTTSEEKLGSSSEDSDSDDESSGDTTSNNEEMEVDQLTSLVSFFSFSQSQQSEYCLSPIHPTGPHILALTA